MEDHSDTGPNEMPFPQLKLISRPGTGDALEDLGPTGFHNLVSFMNEGGVSKEASIFHAGATLLEFSRPKRKYKPIAIGSFSCILVSCSLIK